MTARPEWITGWNNGNGAGVQATPYSGCITYPAGASVVDLLDTIEAFITARGWSLLDANTGTANMRVYTAPNLLDSVGAASAKTMGINLSVDGELLTPVWESWNPATNTGLNLAVNSNSSGWGQRVDLTNGGQLNIAISSRITYLFSRITAGDGDATSNGPSGCVEWTRPTPQDVVGDGSSLPKHGFFSNRQMESNTNFVWQVRRRDNPAGNACITRFGAGGTVNGVSVGNATIMPRFTDALTSQPAVSGMALLGYNSTAANTDVLGEIIGLLAVTRGVGARIGDEITVKVAPNPAYGNELFLGPNGQEQSWWLFGGQGGALMRWAVRK